MHRREQLGPVAALEHGRPVLGIFPPYMTVRCFAVDGLLVDSGLSTHAEAVRQFAAEARVKRVVLTHHHEDHSGNAAALQRGGLPVEASAPTRAWMRRGFAQHFYQRQVWAPAPPAELGALPPVVETARYRFRVLAAPGHCDDQVVLFEPDQGWLFSGDAFLAERVKYFRGDEDFAASVESLRALCTLDFADLYCAHRPVLGGGRDALRRKLARLDELAQEVVALHRAGVAEAEIVRRVLGPDPWFFYWFTGGDLSKANLVRSILRGPVPRADAPGPG